MACAACVGDTELWLLQNNNWNVNIKWIDNTRYKILLIILIQLKLLSNGDCR